MMMTADKLNITASKGQSMPDGLTLPEQYYFQALRLLYKRYHAGDIEREEAQQEKHSIDESFRDMQFNYNLYKHQAELEQVFHKEFFKDGTACKAGNCRLYNILCDLMPKDT